MEQQQSLADLDTTTSPVKAKPVELRTGRDYMITIQAIESRVEELKKLAKKNGEEHYDREARNILADATALESFILPQFQAQRELPLPVTEALRTRLMATLRPMIHEKLAISTSAKDEKAALARREESLSRDIAGHIMLFASKLFDEAYNAGYSAREQNYETFALRATHGLFGQEGA